jgi:hypothetical protein
VPVLTNTFDGGSNGTSITTGNSGGTSGTAWNTVNGQWSFSSSQKHSGTLSGRLQRPEATTGYIAWTSGNVGNQSQLWGRIYVRSTAFGAGGGNVELIKLRDGSSEIGEVRLTGAGVVRVQDADNVGTSGDVTIATNQWVRIEFYYKAGSSNGEITARLYNSADSTTASDTISRTSVNMGSRANGVEFGDQQSTVSADKDDLYFDNIGISTTSWMGPHLSATAVGKSVAVRWNDNAKVGKQVQALWTVRRLVSDTLTARWNTLTKAGKQIAVTWNILAAAGLAGKSLDVQWRVAGFAGKTLGLQWGYSRVGASLGITWNTESGLTDIRIKDTSNGYFSVEHEETVAGLSEPQARALANALWKRLRNKPRILFHPPQESPIELPTPEA